MGKTYILQKDLPDSLKGDKYIWNPLMGYCLDGNRTGTRYSSYIVENNPEWFKEQAQPKEWEIISYYNVFDGSHKPTDSCDTCKINSVKRLGNEQVFTVGDKILREIGDNIIVSFQMAGNEMIAKFNYGGFSNINFIEKDYSYRILEPAFVWTDELVKDFIIDRNNGLPYAPVNVDAYIQRFKRIKNKQFR